MEIKSGTLDVLETLIDGAWHNVYDLTEKHGWKVTSRISDLRNKKKRYQCEIADEKVKNNGEKKYKLLYAPESLLKEIGLTPYRASKLSRIQFSLF